MESNTHVHFADKNGNYDISNTITKANQTRTDILIGQKKQVARWETGSYIMCGAQTRFIGEFPEIILYGSGIYIGKIVNSEKLQTISIFVSNKIDFYDENSSKDKLKEYKPEYLKDLVYFPSYLVRDTVEDHLIGNFKIIHFQENIELIKNNDNIPIDIKEKMLNIIKF